MEQDLAMKTNYTIYSIPAGTLDFLETNQEKIEYLKNNKVPGVKIKKWHNLVPLVLRRAIAQLISWATITPTLKANIIALGSDATVATAADTKLWAEEKRANFDLRYSVDNVAYLDVYFTKDWVWVLDLKEIWVFVDGIVGTPDSWYLLSRINMNEELTGNEDLSINVSFTISW